MTAGPGIVVLGCGPAGLAAAHAASSNGERVTIIDENFAPGGQIWRGGPALWRDRRAGGLWDALRTRTHVRFLFGARVVGPAGAGVLLVDTATGPVQIPAARIVLCTGARELLLPFPGWTLPGVTGAGGLQALVKGGMPVAGKRVVVAGTGPLLLAVAETVRRAGGEVCAIAEHRGGSELAAFLARLALSHRGKLVQSVQLLTSLTGIPYRLGATLVAAHGEDRLRSVVLRHRGREREIACDFLACGFGLLPSLEAGTLLGCAIEGGRVTVDAAQATSRPGVWAAGESTGIGGVDKALAEGRIAGLACTGQVPSQQDLAARSKATAFATLLGHSFSPKSSLRDMCQPSTLVCRCEDVSAARLAEHADWRSAKLQTRAGMGPCQGRICGAACEFLYGWESPGLRQPIFPSSAATLASCARGAKASAGPE